MLLQVVVVLEAESWKKCKGWIKSFWMGLIGAGRGVIKRWEKKGFPFVIKRHQMKRKEKKGIEQKGEKD